MLRLQKCGRGFLYPCLKFKRLPFKQEADVQKSYCLDIGYNLSIIELMEEVGGLDKSGNADFEKLYDHEFMVGIYYNDFGQLITDKIYTILEDDFEEDEGCRMTKEYTGF